VAGAQTGPESEFDEKIHCVHFLSHFSKESVKLTIIPSFPLSVPPLSPAELLKPAWLLSHRARSVAWVLHFPFVDPFHKGSHFRGMYVRGPFEFHLRHPIHDCIERRSVFGVPCPAGLNQRSRAWRQKPKLFAPSGLPCWAARR
jgi:hypothetical protein